MSKHQFYWTATRATFCRWVKLRYRFDLDPSSDPEPEAPYIVVSNHGNFFDPWMIGLYFKKALHIMMNDDGFRAGKVSRWYLETIGAYPKKKGSQDIKAMKNTLSFLRSKEPVLIFPEGQTTWDGETQPIYGGIERIVKRSKCSLAIVRVRGNFLSRPWWAKGPRKGRVSVKRTVIPAKRIKEMSEAEILSAIKDGIYTNDVLDAKNKDAKFKGKRLAEGLERLLWICHKCGTSDRLVTKGHKIRCEECSATWKMNSRCQIKSINNKSTSPKNLHAWVANHKAAVKNALKKAKDETILTQNSKVTLLRENHEGDFTPDTNGTLVLCNSKLKYTPEGATQPSFTFPVKELDNYVIQQKDIFEITYEGTDYRFHMNGKSPMKWLMFVRYLNGFEEIEKLGIL